MPPVSLNCTRLSRRHGATATTHNLSQLTQCTYAHTTTDLLHRVDKSDATWCSFWLDFNSRNVGRWKSTRAQWDR